MKPDVTEKEKDATVEQETASPTPSSTDLIPSVEGTATYTEDQVVKLVAERHGKLDTRLAEQLKWLNLANDEIAKGKVARVKLAELMDTPESELTKVEGGADIAKERAKNREERQSLVALKETQDWEWLGRQELLTKADDMARLVVLVQAAKDFKVPVEKLMELSTESPEVIKSNARVLASLQTPAAQGKTDSGTNTGKGIMTPAQARSAYLAGNLTSEEYAKTRPSTFT